VNAFGRIQIRRPEITPQHLADATMEANLLMGEFSNRNPNQYLLETVPVPMEQGTATYNLPNRSISIGIAYLTIGTGTSAVDRPLGAVSASEYGAYPNKTTQGPPTVYWLNLKMPVPQITIWPVPDSGTYTLNVQSFRQQQDVSLASGQTPDLPYRFYDCFTSGLAARLAVLYPEALVKARGPNAVDAMALAFEKAWNTASRQDQEDVNLYIVPGIGAYL
jgi:hypothetical protein